MTVPENVRDGDPYDDPAFEELARAHDVWGRASGALCAVFWRAGKEAQAREIEALQADRDSWRDQASARVADAVEFAEQAEALRADANAMRIALTVQVDNLMDLGDRHARLMHKRGDADERDSALGCIDHARKVAAPYKYNGPWRSAIPEAGG